jgi:secreted trypsin-like serine protease
MTKRVIKSSYGLVFYCLAMMLVILGCSRASSERQSSGLDIAGGKLVKNDDAVAAATVALVERDREHADKWVIICSGTLIATDIVITAAHCIDGDRAEVQFRPQESASPLVISGRTLKHESYGDPYNEKFSFDLALIKLESPAPATMRPVPRAQKEEYQVGDTVILAGYGMITDPVTGQPQGNEKLLYQARTQIKDIFASGDQDLRDDYENWGLITFRSKDGTSGACAGDSGGPMFIKKEGKLKVIGATAGGLKQDCDSAGWYTNLEFYADWIDQGIHKLSAP